VKRLPGKFRLVIAGSGTHTDEYVQRLKTFAQSDKRIVFVGPRFGAEKVWLLQQARVFVQPSTIEGLSIALLEAMASGCRVLVSDIPENIESLAAARVSLPPRVFRTGNEGDLADKLHAVLWPPSATSTHTFEDSAAAATIRQHYDWLRIADSTERVYDRCLSAAPARRRSGSSRLGHLSPPYA
jgi:glycosyltransferase involved in cell wall biosynthesis